LFLVVGAPLMDVARIPVAFSRQWQPVEPHQLRSEVADEELLSAAPVPVSPKKSLLDLKREEAGIAERETQADRTALQR
jgi:hypothetical protein